MKSPFTYEIPANEERLGELYDTLSPLEPLPDGVTREDFIAAAKETDAAYAVLIDGRLAGIAFVKDIGNRREMGFAKTEYLTSSRRITFARHIPTLFADINRIEGERVSTQTKPMYIHTPDGDDRSRDWFIGAGCVQDEFGLRCPTHKEEF